MDNPWIVAAVTVALIAASAFFVAVEFALVAARRYRLEDAAPHSAAARAALRSASELSVLLAGSQLGITVCTLALGAITKPAVHHWLTPVFDTWGAPLWLADVAGFVLALLIVTFLHLVIGEMAPKSWAIAHPERSAIMLALPMRAFMWLTRPLLTRLNELANWCLRRIGVQPVDEVSAGQNSEALRHLVEHSATVGALDPDDHRRLAAALELESVTVADLMRADPNPSSVPADAGPAQIQTAADATGHLRLLVTGPDGITGVVHVRDALRAPATATAADLARPVLRLAADTPAYQVLRTIQDSRNHLAVVSDGDGRMLGVVTLADILQRLMPTPSRPAT
ncbi:MULTISPECIES: hemolysin family protein [unclassified Nocardia]|uniref:hemolysin family protein n=1 Tax=unclassified Nocardia TaxID=2637762 RepID=UPI0024A9022F|nr:MULTISPECIES: hemolysin family protein [unclassified Nocardia]